MDVEMTSNVLYGLRRQANLFGTKNKHQESAHKIDQSSSELVEHPMRSTDIHSG
jgi:hypothetical protein